MPSRSGTVTQGALRFQREDYGHQHIHYPVLGIVLAVYASDETTNRSQNAAHDGRGSQIEARVLVLNDGSDSPWILGNVVVLPRGSTGYDNYSEELPKGVSGAIDEAQITNSMQDVSKTKLDGDFCVALGTKILGADLVWRSAEQLKVGEELIGFDESLSQKTAFRSSIVQATKIIEKPCLRIKTEKGDLICSRDHMWVARRPYGNIEYQAGVRQWLTAETLQVGDYLSYAIEPWEVDTTYDAGYLAGFFDGEGWVGGLPFRSGVGFGQNPGVVLEHVLELLRERNFVWGSGQVSRRVPNSKCLRYKLTGPGRPSLRLLGSIRPKRLLLRGRELWNGAVVHGKKSERVPILSIQDVGIQKVVALQTSTHTFIANGFLSHNCVVSFIGGRINQPFMLAWWPHPANSADPATAGVAGTLQQGRRSVKRFQGTRLAITSKGTVLVDTSEANQPLKQGQRQAIQDGGDIRVTVKDTRQLEFNWNPSVYGDPAEPDFLWDQNPPVQQQRSTTNTVCRFTKDEIDLIAGAVVKIIAQTGDVTIQAPSGKLSATAGSSATLSGSDVSVTANSGEVTVSSPVEILLKALTVEIGNTGLTPPVNGVVIGSGIDAFTGVPYFALGNASFTVMANK